MLFPKKYPDIQKGWKSKIGNQDNLLSKPKVKKEIPKISDKKKKRLKEQGSEGELFRKIWGERSHYCEICKKAIREPKPHNFDHKIPKSRGEKYRLDESNIQILCFSCHFEKTTGLKYKGILLD